MWYVVGSIPHGGHNYFLFQPVLHDWCCKGHGLRYPFCGMVHIKEPLLLIKKIGECFFLSLTFLTVLYNFLCLMSYIHKIKCVKCVIKYNISFLPVIFSFQPVLHDWCNKGRGMCYPVCGMVHIKEPFLLIGKSSLCGGSGFPFSLSEWS